MRTPFSSTLAWSRSARPSSGREKLWNAPPPPCGERSSRDGSAIGLKLGAERAKRFVLGWEIRRDTPEFVLLGAESRIGMPAELLLKREEHALLFATLVQQDNQIARAVWAGTEPVHVPIVRRILDQASRRCRP